VPLRAGRVRVDAHNRFESVGNLAGAHQKCSVSTLGRTQLCHHEILITSTGTAFKWSESHLGFPIFHRQNYLIMWVQIGMVHFPVFGRNQICHAGCRQSTEAGSLSGHCFRALFQGSISGLCFRVLFQDPVSGSCFRALFQGPVSGSCFRALFQGPVSGFCFRVLFQGSCFKVLFHCSVSRFYVRTQFLKMCSSEFAYCLGKCHHIELVPTMKHKIGCVN
jgi:hypothetical protein